MPSSTPGGRAIAVVGDAGLAADVDALFERTSSEFGPVDILVNNAGLVTDQRHFFDGDEEWWDRFLRVNLKSQYLCTDRAARIMAHHGGGAIVNVSSGGATRAHRGMAAYDASKGGIEAFTRTTALELAPYGIRVNTLVPGLIATSPDEPEWSLRAARRDRPAGTRWPGRGPRRTGPVPGLRRRGLRDRREGAGRRRCAGPAAQPAGRHPEAGGLPAARQHLSRR